jgi:hypothetical protein
MILPDHYWLAVDPATGNPLESGGTCWAYYYPGDKPLLGHYILVKKVEEPIEDEPNEIK